MIEEQIRDALQHADAGARPEFGAELEARLAAEYDGVDGMADLVDMTSRRPRRWALATIGIAATLAVLLGVGLFARTSNDGSVTATTTVTRTPKQQAQALAAKLLDDLALPPGAVAAKAPLPVNFGRLDPSTTVRATKAWLVPMSVADADAYLRAHSTSGMKVTATGTIGGGKSFTADLHPLPDGYAAASVDLVLEPAGNATHLTAEARVIWYPPRPLAEHIPARDKVVTATFGSKGSKVFTDAPTVNKLIAQFESSPTALDGVHSCPSLSLHPGMYTLKFAASPSARPDVVVTIVDGGCRGARVRVGAHDAPVLYGYSMLEAVRGFFH